MSDGAAVLRQLNRDWRIPFQDGSLTWLIPQFSSGSFPQACLSILTTWWLASPRMNDSRRSVKWKLCPWKSHSIISTIFYLLDVSHSRGRISTKVPELFPINLAWIIITLAKSEACGWCLELKGRVSPIWNI